LRKQIQLPLLNKLSQRRRAYGLGGSHALSAGAVNAVEGEKMQHEINMYQMVMNIAK
jgi:hypothetical protein